VVGAIWYTFGLGEAMVYRQQMRAATDAAAFDSAVVHALGMNMLSMMNIAMAAVLSILVLLMIIFLAGLALTVIALILMLIPGLDIIDLGALTALVNFDLDMVDTIEEVQPEVFDTLTVLNVSEGFVAIAMPWIGFVSSMQPAGEYGGAVTSTGSFSPSMIPTRLPYLSNKLDAWLKDKLPEIEIFKGPGGLLFPEKGKLQPSLKVPLLQRYGLPVQDDNYSILCMHAGMVLVNEGGTLVQLMSFGLIPSSIFNKFGEVLGSVVGSVPWMFCSGLDPVEMLSNLGFGGVANKALNDIFKKAKDLSAKEHPSMFPMKPFDDSKNGNDFLQVWAWSSGQAGLGGGAVTGVGIAGFESHAPDQNAGSQAQDIAEAEFYFDCGSPDSGSDQVISGTSDTGGDWQNCKYNAMWNLGWKARLRRYHQFQWDIRKDIETSIYQGLGIDSLAKALLPNSLQEGSLAKVQVLDRLKSCVTSIGSGSNSGTGSDVGACPFPIGTWIFGSGGIGGNGGKVGLGPSTADGYPMDEVLH
ncbi:MAG: hypothetical protein FWD17_01350, partial [Polyangiaceae bacterium]|nr:hypothetical protein [Polyangiaceae bacterium]